MSSSGTVRTCCAAPLPVALRSAARSGRGAMQSSGGSSRSTGKGTPVAPGTTAAPSRQELLDQLKLKLEGDKAKKIEPDKDFIDKLEAKFGKDFVEKLKTDSGRADFLEKRLTLAYRDRFLEANLNRFGATDTQRFRERFEATEKYYDKL